MLRDVVFHKITQFGALLILASLLSACLLTRVYEFKNQFCDYPRYFELQVGQEIALSMLQPVLLDTDVVWLMGAVPSYREQSEDELELVYVIEKDLPLPDSQYAIPLRLRFKMQDGEFRLSAGVIDKNLGAMITPELIDEVVSHTCESSTSIINRNVTVDLSALDSQSIPHRGDIETALGLPTNVDDSGQLAMYQFRLRDAPSGVEKSSARIWYAKDGWQVKRIQLHYLRYQFDANFEAGVGVISIEL